MKKYNFKEEINSLCTSVLKDVNPYNIVKKELQSFKKRGKLIVLAIGKAGYTMGLAAKHTLGNNIDKGLIITKHGHKISEIEGFQIIEAGHPISDSCSYLAGEATIRLVSNLKEEDDVIVLLSGGGSSLLEVPLISQNELENINENLLKKPIDIRSINSIRKKLSGIKGGKLAKIIAPAKVHLFVLSDIVGDPLDMIASGPCSDDNTETDEVLNIINKWNIKLSNEALQIIKNSSTLHLNNVNTKIIGNVKLLCESAMYHSKSLGYKPILLGNDIEILSKDLGETLGRLSQKYLKEKENIALIAGGETVVKVKGRGLGGRNQEIALWAAPLIKGNDNVCVFSIGSDGTDGPTDAAGGFVLGDSYERIPNFYDYLENNDSYHALELIDGLIKTGPTGSNVNDLSVLLVKNNE